MYARVEPSGCTERYGLVQVRLSMCLEEGDFRYDDPSRFHVIDWNSHEARLGYQGLVDVEGRPLDLEQYAAWEKSLPRVWLKERGFHNHFIYFDPYTMRDEDITDAIAHHLPNFYKAWTEEWDAVPGGMRHGFDVKCRGRQKRWNKLDPAGYLQRRLDCLLKVDVLKASAITLRPALRDGETFPSTDIDIGPGATDRSSHFGDGYTLIDLSNAANDTGSLDTFEFWFYYSAQVVKAGTFFGSGTSQTPRDYESIGSVLHGSKQSFTGLNCDVTSGDLLGVYSNGDLEFDSSGYVGVYYKLEDQLGAGAQTYTLSAGPAISIYGTGATAGWSNIAKVAGVTATDLAKIDGVLVADIAKINGVAV